MNTESCFSCAILKHNTKTNKFKIYHFIPQMPSIKELKCEVVLLSDVQSKCRVVLQSRSKDPLTERSELACLL